MPGVLGAPVPGKEEKKAKKPKKKKKRKILQMVGFQELTVEELMGPPDDLRSNSDEDEEE